MAGEAMMSEREKMLGGEPYDSRDPELLALMHRGRALVADFCATPSTEPARRHAILTSLLAHAGEGVWIEPPFFCDYGAHLSIGEHTFVNFNCTFLDCARITIGARVLLGPGVQLLTATHPLRASERLPSEWTRESGTMLYRTYALPITIGDHAWVGAGSIVLPGVTIGEGAVIGAGSVVVRDIPPHVLAFGNPCRVQREL